MGENTGWTSPEINLQLFYIFQNIDIDIILYQRFWHRFLQVKYGCTRSYFNSKQPFSFIFLMYSLEVVDFNYDQIEWVELPW